MLYQPSCQKSNQNRKVNPAAVALGRLGGLRGGPARAKKLSAKKREAIAQKAARDRRNRGRAAPRVPHPARRIVSPECKKQTPKARLA